MVTIEESVRLAKPVQAAHHDLQIVSSEVHWFKMNASNNEKGFVAALQPIMCDFEVVKDDESPAKFFITLMIEMENSRDNDRVLSFQISTLTAFAFLPRAQLTKLPAEEEKQWHLFEDALSIAISNARAYLVNYLAPTYHRKYILPMLNVAELISRKYTPPSLPTVPSAAPSEKPPRKPTTRKPRD